MLLLGVTIPTLAVVPARSGVPVRARVESPGPCGVTSEHCRPPFVVVTRLTRVHWTEVVDGLSENVIDSDHWTVVVDGLSENVIG